MSFDPCVIDFSQAIGMIEKAEDILIFTHINMDGDAMGSTIALCRVLRKLGKKARILVEDRLPAYLDFMGTEWFVSLDLYREQLSGGAAVPQLAVCLDIGDESRLEGRLSEFQAIPASVCIDHHEPKYPFCDLALREPAASAASLLLQCMLEQWQDMINRPLIDKEVAEALYVGILTDTGAFKYSNTDAATHHAAARLYACGIDHAPICTAIYDNYEFAQLAIEGIALDRAVLCSDGKGIVSFVTLKDLESTGATSTMSETCIDRIRSVHGVEIAAILKERENGTIKLSLRSKGRYNVNGIAAKFDGGGHLKAAGGRLSCGMEEAVALVKAAIEEELS